jgi:dipeptidyl aminopeptidase/acylaminoacyl peptidase
VSTLAALSNRDPGILLVDATTGAYAFYATTYGTLGEFAPDSSRIVFPKLVAESNQIRTVIESVELDGGQTARVPVDVPIDPGQIEWRPDGSALALARRFLGDERTRGWQIFLLPWPGGAMHPLVNDPLYDNVYFEWAPDGRSLVIQRAPVQGGDDQQEIWTYEVGSGEARRVAINAFSPRWVR